MGSWWWNPWIGFRSFRDLSKKSPVIFDREIAVMFASKIPRSSREDPWRGAWDDAKGQAQSSNGLHRDSPFLKIKMRKWLAVTWFRVVCVYFNGALFLLSLLQLFFIVFYYYHYAWFSMIIQIPEVSLRFLTFTFCHSRIPKGAGSFFQMHAGAIPSALVF